MTKAKAHVAPVKKETVKRFTKLIDSYHVVAAVDVENLPALQLNTMRANLRGKAELVMTKRRLLNIAIDNSKKENIQELKKYLKGMPALLFSNENPFKLYKILKKSKSKAPIKAGQKAPHDIEVKAGPTGFAPGPIIGELGSLGIKAGIDGGKVAIKADATVAKEGQIITPKLAGILQRLQIMPMEIGLNLIAAYEDGSIIDKKVLDIDEDQIMASVRTAASEAHLLAMEIAFPTKDNAELLIQKAHREAFTLADSQAIVTKDTLGKILAKAEAQASAVKSETNT